MQPVFHSYDIWRYWILQPGVISSMQVPTKFLNHDKVKTRNFLDISTTEMAAVLDVIQCHYLPSEQATFTLSSENLQTLCNHHSSGPCWVSMYFTDHFHVKDATVVNSPEVAGVLISYPVRMFLHNAGHQPIYYWDYVVMHREIGKDVGTIRTLIQTHEANQRGSDIPASLFRKDVDLSEGIVPLVQFTVSQFQLIKERIQRPPLAVHCTVTPVRKETINGLFDSLYDLTTNKNIFTLCLFPDLTAWEARLERNEWQVYTLKSNDDIVALYVFRTTHTAYEDGLLECIVSVSLLDDDANLFFAGWLHALYDLLQITPEMSRLSIPNLGHNSKLLQTYTWKYKASSTHDAAYYLYNYVCPGMPLSPHQCWIAL